MFNTDVCVHARKHKTRIKKGTEAIDSLKSLICSYKIKSMQNETLWDKPVLISSPIICTTAQV